MLDEIKNIKSGKKQLREFGLTIGVILVILGAVALWRNKNTYPCLIGWGGIFIILGLALPRILKPLQKSWMALSIIMGFFASRVILTVLFYMILTPLGLAARILRKDILDQRIDKARSSYWHERSPKAKPRESYEKQF